MNPADAYARVLASGPFDDPLHSWYPVRWYFDRDGVLCRSAWRDAAPQRYPEYRRCR